ncbi:uncharacterized protein LOC126735198 [Anthonomus grandis grandis]|uniref:uncharacterized protein LOC126735198 n=1 Tax=Anthonomus grandis grandis TaxID=2921223 RepID=UPI0021665F6B|nr:uncharacterized protein LOC126735198 [Anthonomus grandis grandis]
MKAPNKEKLIVIAEDFYIRSNFPNCLGAVYGKHIRLMAPQHSGSQYFNYKKFFSVVLMAIADANYCFVAVDIGAYGKEGDSNVFKRSTSGKRLYGNKLYIPESRSLPYSNGPAQPFVFVADEAFGLHTNLLRPYCRRNFDDRIQIFNYRLTGARRFVECTFGILANKCRVFHNLILVHPDFAVQIIKAACALHNFVRKRYGYQFEDSLSCNLDDIAVTGTGGNRQTANAVRDFFANYFITPEEAVQWQQHMI